MGTEENKLRQTTGLYEWVRTLVSVVLLVTLVFTFVFRLIRVDGESMRDTLQHQDLLLALNPIFCGEYERGDVVIIRTPTFNSGRPIVKRVIATAGETVEIDYSTGSVFVDGVELMEFYIREPTYVDEGIVFPLEIPEGCVFVMGDNRNRSDDSRNPLLGPVNTGHILGKATLLVLPGVSADTNVRDFSRIGKIAW